MSDTLIGIIVIVIVVIALFSIMGYIDWLHSTQPADWEFEQGAGEEYRP